MNRRFFLGSLLTAAVIPEAVAGKRVQHQIPTKNTKKPKGTTQPNASTTISRARQPIAQKPALRSIAPTPTHPPFSTQPVAEVNEGRPYYLSLLHTHTDETLEIAYRIGSVYQRSALKRLNYFLRDFRTEEVAFIDPRLFDQLYLIQQRTRSPDATFEIISAYRSIETNEELRRYSSHVARNSLHLTGQALDIRLQRTNIRAVRNAALELEAGGVGFYKGADFVHIDTGEVRRWIG